MTTIFVAMVMVVVEESSPCRLLPLVVIKQVKDNMGLLLLLLNKHNL
jgi:hypothetical protein